MVLQMRIQDYRMMVRCLVVGQLIVLDYSAVVRSRFENLVVRTGGYSQSS